MVSSSSTRKAARLAQKGKGKKVRFQGGTLFPMVVVGILVVGLGAIIYGRQSQPEASASPPTVNDHWHHAFGFELCSQDNFPDPPLSGALEEQDPNTGQFVDDAFNRTGVHSHDDGVIHWHAFTSAAVGNNATLGLFLDNYGVELDDNSLKFPENQRTGREAEYVEGETKCDGEDGELKVVVWNNYQDADADGTTYSSDFDDIRLDRDSMAITIAFVPNDVDVVKPPSAPNLPELGAADQGQPEPGGGTVPPEGTAPGGSAVPGATTPAGSAPTTTEQGSRRTTPPTTAPAPTATG